MTTIIRFIEKAGLAGVFDDHATKVMGDAFDAACKDLRDTGQPDLVYEVIAKRIIEAAKWRDDEPVCRRQEAVAAEGARAKKGSPSTHPIRGEELRALRPACPGAGSEVAVCVHIRT